MAQLSTLPLPTPPALIYLLHQLREHHIGYRLFGIIPNSDMAFVDLDIECHKLRSIKSLPEKWQFITPHFMAHRAIADGFEDPIQSDKYLPEEIVIAFGGPEAEEWENFKALCQQVNYLRQRAPSRLIYENTQPPDALEIHQLIAQLTFAGASD